MDKKIQYAIGGVAVIGIIAYLYNKKKKDDALKMATSVSQPSILNADNTLNANAFLNAINFNPTEFAPLTQDDFLIFISQWNEAIRTFGLEKLKLQAQQTINVELNSPNPRVSAFAKLSQFILSKLP
jgi:hypothetical protein